MGVRAYPVFKWLFEASVGAAVLVGLILLARKTLRGALGSKLIYALGLLAVLRLLLPFQLPSFVLPQVESDAGTVSIPEAAELQVRKVTHELSETLATAVQAQPYERITQADIAAYHALQPNSRGIVWLGVYAVGVVLTGGLMAWRNHRFRRYLKRHAIGELDGEAVAVYAQCAQALHLRPVKALMVDPLDSACLVGGLRPLIALPVTDSGNRYILLHELCHQKNGDALWGILRNVCCALFWFHPLVWVAARLSRADCEMACDERMAACLTAPERTAYATLLVKLAACNRTPRAGVLATGMSMTGTRLKQRVGQILTDRRVKLWAVIAAGMLSLSALTTCFATATVIPADIQASFTADEPQVQDEWLKRDVAAWFPNGDFNAVKRDNTTVSTRYGGTILFGWAYDAGLTVACAAQADGAGEPYPIHTTYTTGLNGETRETCVVAPFDDARWQSLRNVYYSYEAAYDADGTLRCLYRQPRVSAFDRRIVQRSAGHTFSGLEYEVRKQDELQSYTAWARAHSDQFDSAVSAAQQQAMAIGWPVTTVVGTLYLEAFEPGDPYALQLVTLQTPDGHQATFTVEMESWRVLAISFSDDFMNGLVANTGYSGIDPQQVSVAPKPQNEALIRETALTALQTYFDYTLADDAAITLGPAYEGDDTFTGWELTVTPATGNLRYRLEVNTDGVLRRAVRTVYGMDFSEQFDMDSFPYLNENPERYHLSAKTVFWLNGGATLATGEQTPPEVQAAITATDEYIAAKGLPFTQCTGYSLTWDDSRLLQREADIGLEFTYCKGDDDQGYRLFYSTLQQAVGAVDFGEE